MRYEYPSLRQGLVFAACPSLGASGLKLIDRSGQNNHGTLNNMAGQSVWQPVAGVPGLTFDGSNDYVDFGLAPACDFGAGNCTISMWALFPSFGSNRSFFSKGTTSGGVTNGLSIISFSYLGTNYAQCNFGVSGTQNDTNCNPLSANVWYHLAWQLSRPSRFAFVNGVQTDSRASMTGTVNSSSYNLQAGRDYGSNAYGNSTLDDIRIYSRALTLAEIRLLASRRGIGLTPLPDRGGGLPRKLSVNVGGTWRSGDTYVNSGSGWRLGIPYVNVGGTFR
jgi:hypothetical protein